MDEDALRVRLYNNIYWAYQLPPSPTNSVVVLTCNDNHKMEGFFFFFFPDMTFGVLFQLHLVRSGGTVHIMVTWHASTGGIQCFTYVSFGFPVNFQLFVPNSIKLSSFSLSSLLSPICAIIALCSSSRNFLSRFPFLGLFLLRYSFFSHALFFIMNFTGKRLLVFSFSCFGIWSPPPPPFFSFF